jgi:hypothetical protein
MGGEEGEEEGKVGSTELGDVMSRTFIKYETVRPLLRSSLRSLSSPGEHDWWCLSLYATQMRKLKNLPPQATLRQVLETLCDADE